MAGRFSVVATMVIMTGIALGPGGCSDAWDLDPPNRIVYEGAHQEQVYACGRLSIDGMFEYTGEIGIRYLVGDISITEQPGDQLTIEGRTRHESAGDEAVRDWVCLINTDQLDAEIISENTFVEAR